MIFKKIRKGHADGETFYVVLRQGIMYSKKMHMKTRLTGQQRI